MSALPAWSTLALELLGNLVRGRALRPLPALDEDIAAQLRRRRIVSLYHLQAGRDSVEQRLYDRIWQAQREAYLELIDTLLAHHVQPLVFKGAEALARHFEPHGIGTIVDVDLLVPMYDLGKTKQQLYRLGYINGAYDRERNEWRYQDLVDIARLELIKYELCPFSRLAPLTLSDDELELARVLARGPTPIAIVDEKPFVVLYIDIHHGVGHGVDTKPLFARAEPSALGRALTFCPADHVWFNVRRYYLEAAQGQHRSLRHFAYIAPWLRDPSVDWSRVVEQAKVFEACAPLYYWLTFLDQIGGGVIPAGVLDSLKPTPCARHNDLGWQLGPLLDFVDLFPFNQCD